MTVEQFKKEYGIIGKTKEINDLADISMQIAKSDISVLLYGESGTGKEVFANAIHQYSNRSNKQLVSVNCGAIPEGLLESELFGHKKGAYTGAIETRKGYFEIADGGTLFLDEIAEMPYTTQVRFLRALESKEFMRIGDEHITKVDIRVIAATNKDLQKEVEAKRFREDLYFRLKAVALNIPPLRKRLGDIEDLARFFISKYENGKKNITITDDAILYLQQYNWPGNIRELKNAIESAVALTRSNVLDVSSFEHLINLQYQHTENRNLPVYLKKTPEEADREILYRALFEIKKDLLEVKDLLYERSRELNAPSDDKKDVDILTLAEIEQDAIKNAIEKTRGNKREAAKMLGISERTFYRKLKELED